MIIVDTTVIIDIARGKLVAKEFINDNPNIYAISEITLTEIFTGIYYTFFNQGNERFLFEREKYNQIINDFHQIPLSNIILINAGKLIAKSQFEKKTMFLADAIIIATAQAINAEKILTRNLDHFIGCEIPVESYSTKSQIRSKSN